MYGNVRFHSFNILIAKRLGNYRYIGIRPVHLPPVSGQSRRSLGLFVWHYLFSITWLCQHPVEDPTVVKRLYLRKVQRHGSQTCPIRRVHLVRLTQSQLPHTIPACPPSLPGFAWFSSLAQSLKFIEKIVFWRDMETIPVYAKILDSTFYSENFMVIKLLIIIIIIIILINTPAEVHRVTGILYER